MTKQLALFALGSSRPLGEAVARDLGVGTGAAEERDFEDGEFKVRPLESVLDRDVYVISSLNGVAGESGADRLCKLLFFIGALKDAGAARVTAVAPDLCFSRKDRRTKARDPITTRYVAQLFEAMACDAVMTLDVHNVAAFENAFRCETIPLDAHELFAQHIASEIGDSPVAVVSPDLGGEKRAELFRLLLERRLGHCVAKAFMDKTRSEGRVTGDIFAGDVSGRLAIILDDLIAGGGTVARCAAACRAHGAARVVVMATHGVFTAGASDTLRNAPIDSIVVTDSVSISPADPVAQALQDRLTTLSAAPLIAEAIRRRQAGGSISEPLAP
jgi:ribose-phosphate pyrophosphokinase